MWSRGKGRDSIKALPIAIVVLRGNRRTAVYFAVVDGRVQAPARVARGEPGDYDIRPDQRAAVSGMVF